jgi:hypothetical protein
MNVVLRDILAMIATTVVADRVSAQSARDIRGSSLLVDIEKEASPKLIVDSPLPEQLALGRVLIQYRAENLRTVLVVGSSALDGSPRIGHIHETVDGAPWLWADASGEHLVAVGLPPGPHKVLIELANLTHKVITSQAIQFSVPDLKTSVGQ